MKKLTVLLLTLVTAISLSACGEDKVIIQTPEGTVELEGEEAEKWKEEHNKEEKEDKDEEKNGHEKTAEPEEAESEDLQSVDWDAADIHLKVPTSCETEFDKADGLYIYAEDYGCIPYVLVSRLASDNDAEGYLEKEFLPMMKESYGDNLLEVSEIKSYDFGEKKLPGIKVKYALEGGTVDCFTTAEKDGKSIIRYMSKTVTSGEEDVAEFVQEILDDSVKSFNAGSSSDTDSKPSEKESAKSDKGSTEGAIGGGDQTAASNIKYVEYSDKYFTMDVPEGWKVNIVNTDPLNYTIEVYDPSNPDRDMLYCSSLQGFPKSEEAHDFWMRYYPDLIFAKMPYLTEISTENFFKKMEEAFGYSDFQILENKGRTQYLGDLLIGSAISSNSGNEIRGIFTAWVYDTGVVMVDKDIIDWTKGKVDTGFAGASVIVMEVAPASEYKEWVPVLNNSFASLKFTDEYRKDYKESWEAVMKTNCDLSAIADETREKVAQSWIDF